MFTYGNIGLFDVKKSLQPAFNKLTADVTVRGISVFCAPTKGFDEISVAVLRF